MNGRPLRLVYAGNFEWPAPQARSIQSLHTAHALARAGAQVLMPTIRPREQVAGESQPEALAHYGLNPHANLRFRPLPVLRVPHRLSRIDIHARLAVTNLSYCALAAGLVVASMRSWRPDWILTRDPRVAWTFIRLRRLTGVPVIYEVHELFATRPRDNRSLSADELWGVSERTRRLETDILTRADRLITLTEACRGLILQEHGVDPGRVQAIPDGTALCARAPAAQKDRTIFYVGQLYRWKGVDTLVEALARVSDSRLVVVGSGNTDNGVDADLARLTHLAENKGVADRVEFRPFVPYREVGSQLRSAAVAALPLPDLLMSRFFTSPLKLFDYMAAGVPIVASDLPAVREVLRHEDNGLLVPPDDPGALASALRRLLDDRDLGRRLAEQANRDVQAYTWDRRAERMLSFLGG